MIPRFDVPISIGRDEAADAARRELAKPEYAAHRPSWLAATVQKVLDWLSGVLDNAAAVAPGGLFGLLVIIAAVALLVGLVVWRVGPFRRTAAADKALFVGRTQSASDHRRAADAAAAAGDWDEAVRQRFRAVVRVLEERDAIDERPGRTADEAASDAARVLPDIATDLVGGARLFDEVAYGGRVAGRDDDDRLRTLDQAAGRAALRVVTTGGVDQWHPVG